MMTEFVGIYQCKQASVYTLAQLQQVIFIRAYIVNWNFSLVSLNYQLDKVYK